MASILSSIFGPGTGEIDYAAFSKTGSCYNPTALKTPPPVLVPSGITMSPSNASAFTGSILKIADNRNKTAGGVETFTYPTSNPIAQGVKGCVDLCNGATNITVNALYGTGGINGERVSSVKGCSNIKLVGSRNCNGSWATHILGRYYAEGKTVDTNIDYSGIPGGGTIIIARGFWDYVFGNRNDINIGSCKVAYFKSFFEWALCVIKTIVTPPKSA